MISLADLRARKVTPIWQESVAVVQELIQTVKATTGSAELLPDLGHVALIPNGDVVAMPGQPGARKPRAPCRGHAAAAARGRAGASRAGAVCRAECGRSRRSTTRWRSFRGISRSSSAPAAGRMSSAWSAVRLAAEQTSRADEELQRLKERASEATQVMAAAGIPSGAAEGQDGPDRPGCGHRSRDHWRRVVVVVAGPRISGARLRRRCSEAGRLPEPPLRLNPPPHPLPRALRRGRRHPPRDRSGGERVARRRRWNSGFDTWRGAAHAIVSDVGAGRTLAAGSRQRCRPLGRELLVRVSLVAGARGEHDANGIDRGEDGRGAPAKPRPRPAPKKAVALPQRPRRWRLRLPSRSWFRPRQNPCRCRSLSSRPPRLQVPWPKSESKCSRRPTPR